MIENNKVLNIFIGPQKTGTSWIYDLLSDGNDDKEIAFPVRFGREYVFNKYVVNSKYLVWPYLLHHPKRLYSLLEFIRKNGREFRLYSTARDKESWKKSMTRFLIKNGKDANIAELYADDQWMALQKTLDKLEENYPVTYINVFNPSSSNIKLLSSLSGRSEIDICGRLETPVYKTKGKSRLPINLLVKVYFFYLKPFLPKYLRRITSKAWLKKAFYKY